MLTSIELFAGAGGLALGAQLAGVNSLAAVEWDRWACETLSENKTRGHPLVKDLNVILGDVRTLDYNVFPENVDLVTGGPPCQPFSIGGKHKAFDDERDMFSAFANAVSKIKPRAFIIENVKGLTRSKFANYLSYIELMVSMPEVTILKNEEWVDHHRRLEECKSSTDAQGLRYNVVKYLANAADFGVAQKRERLFIVGFRSDQNVHWSFPTESHSYDALLREQWVTKSYWDRHRVAKRDIPEIPTHLRHRVEAIRKSNSDLGFRAWRTVRDAIQGLPDPNAKFEESLYHNHKFQGGARIYQGHTGSPLDLPAKTLKAGDHGVPGGENMMVYPDGSVRYFTAREAARIQGFPDGYVFHGAWSEIMRQLGNAVPVRLAQLVVSSVAEKLIEADYPDHRNYQKLN